jgi:prepilin signal peptidase PulO-like enzyme (type II secretory pathway)
MASAGMSRGPKIPSLLRRVGLSFVLGFGLFVLGALLQGVLGKHRPNGISIYVDDAVLGAVAGLVVFAYEQRRYKSVLEKIAVVSAMNHHVRNALQAISYSPYTEQAKQIQLIQQSVARIQWALQEVLPGAVDEAHKISPLAHDNGKGQSQGQAGE